MARHLLWGVERKIVDLVRVTMSIHGLLEGICLLFPPFCRRSRKPSMGCKGFRFWKEGGHGQAVETAEHESSVKRTCVVLMLGGGPQGQQTVRILLLFRGKAS